ncbi:hypothetical protein BCR39DRAFT_589011 [Naematelia encephala]|uniref:Tet-like 2OG-Fe(II) oxygenase domain-containing protein n=1 Tax=Naematelia encephala TaxID=71784 RepID=A0A1Y2AZN6_9TREE|nr:hypothetical protein BCR39DRAFT_589011 [Naematelia encephala]
MDDKIRSKQNQLMSKRLLHLEDSMSKSQKRRCRRRRSMAKASAYIELPKLTAQLADTSQSLVVLSHLAEVDLPKFRVLKVCHSQSRLEKIRSLEALNGDRPMGCITLDEAKQHLDVTIVKDGFSVLWDEEQGTCVGVISFRNLNKLDEVERDKTIRLFEVLDKVCATTNNLAKTNGAKCLGRMHAWGWSPSFAPSKAVKRYKPAPGSDKTQKWDELAGGEIEEVAAHLETRFRKTYRCGFEAVKTTAEEHHVVPFSASNPNCSKLQAGPNSLTVTKNGFSNRQHQDHDLSPYTFGMFFAGNATDGRFNGDVHGGNGKVIGGEFFWGGYGIVVGTAADDEFVELMWRGPQDFHGTLACRLGDGQSWKNVSRWGCSMQMTKAYRQRSLKYMDHKGQFPEELIDD